MRPLEVSFRPSGCMRFAHAVFLLAWLAGWGVGEWFALRVVLWSFTGGTSSTAARSALHPMGWLVGGFILVWLIFWTLGGIAAIVELARLTLGRDTLTFGSGGWTVRRAVGPFASTKHFEPREVRDVFLGRRGSTLMLDTTHGEVVVTTYGTPDERRAIAKEYSRREEALHELPAGWVAERQADGRIRIARAKIDSPGCLLFVGFFAALAATFAILFAAQLPRWGIATAATVAVLAAALFVWGALSRREWLARRDEILLVTRFLQWRRERRIENGSLYVERTVDSDGDESYSLYGTSDGKRVLVHRELHDDRTVLRLARTLEKASGWSVRIDFHD